MSVLRIVLYGFVIWALKLTVAMLASPLREAERPLFESIITVGLTIAITTASALSFRHIRGGFMREGIRLAVVWLVVSLVLDALAFSPGPMQMGLAGYPKDIDITYLIIPVIPIGIGLALDARDRGTP